jgi:hypothetical protein
VLFHDVPRTDQPQARPADLAPDILPPVIRLEDVRQVGRRDAQPLIFDDEARARGAGRAVLLQRQHNGAPGGTVFDRIREQVGEHALQAARIPLAHQGGDRGDDLQLMARIGGLQLVHRLAGERDEIDRLPVQLKRRAGLQLRHIYQLVEQGGHLANLVLDLGKRALPARGIHRAGLRQLPPQ